MIEQLLNNFYFIRIFYILLFILLAFSVVHDLKNRNNIEIKYFFDKKNININLLLKYLFISFMIRIILEQVIISINISITDVQVPINVFEIITEFIATCIFAPIFEEIIFRFGLYKKINSKLNVFISMIITSIIFTAIHFYNIDGYIILIPISLIWNYLFYKTNNLFYPILLHFFHNLYALTSNLFYFNNYWYILLFFNILGYFATIILKKQKN